MPYQEDRSINAKPSDSELAFTNEHQLRPLSPVRITDLLHGAPLDHHHLKLGQDTYQDLAQRPLHPFLIFDSDHKLQQIVVVGPPLIGYQLGGLFHFAAPSKTFGGSPSNPFDRADTRQDWGNLFGTSREDLLSRHQKIPGWQHFQSNIHHILPFIEHDHLFTPPPESLATSPKITPVIRYRSHEGRLPWVFDNLDPALWTALEPHLSPAHDLAYTLPVLGPTFLAAYSPDVTHAKHKPWPEYHPTPDGTGNQNMGPTQLLPLSLMLSHTLNRGVLAKQLVSYTLTNQIRNFDLPDYNAGLAGLHTTKHGLPGFFHDLDDSNNQLKLLPKPEDPNHS